MTACTARRFGAAALFFSSLLAGPTVAQQTVNGVFGTLNTIDGRTITGTLRVDAEGAASLVTDSGQFSFDLGELRSFVHAGVEARNVQVENHVWLRSGQELPARKLSGRRAADGKPAVLSATLPCGVTVDVPVGMLQAVRHGGLQRPQPALFRADLAAPPANEDLIFVQKGSTAQRSSVVVTAFTADKVEFQLRGESYEFDMSGLAAVVFGSSTGFAPDRQPRPRTVVALTTGERIEGRLIGLDTRLRLRLDEGVDLEFPLATLHRLEVSSDRLVWLTELEPEVAQTPAFDRVWPWLEDRCPAGAGFELAGAHFERGLGLVPLTRLTYDLGKRFDVFEATIGIDDRGGPEAHAVFRVFVDGKLAFESQPMTRGLAPVPLHLPLSRAATLALEVDFGKNYDLGDFCAFADARVIQK